MWGQWSGYARAFTECLLGSEGIVTDNLNKEFMQALLTEHAQNVMFGLLGSLAPSR
jgi:hypothetical protein